MATALHCPHCGAPLPDHARAHALRCPTCRLVVGPGRAISGAEAGPVSAGTSAGIRASAARRADAEELDRDEVIAAIGRVSETLGGSCERLRMLDYDALAQQDETLPALAGILSTFGSWKAARAAAARRLREPAAAAAEDLAAEAG